MKKLCNYLLLAAIMFLCAALPNITLAQPNAQPDVWSNAQSISAQMPTDTQKMPETSFSETGFSATGLPPVPDHVSNTKCYSCHANPDLKAVTSRGTKLNLLIPQGEFERSVHGKMPCINCHAYTPKETDFSVIPHKQDTSTVPSCMNCHNKAFAHIEEQVGKSQHFIKQGSKIQCIDCHNPHTQQRIEPVDSYAASVKAANAPCISCHTNLSHYKELTGKAVYTQNLSHEFLPKRDKHFASVRCVECHTPADNPAQALIHRILPKEQSLRDCVRCHTSENSLLVARISSFTNIEQAGGSFVGKGFFDDAELIKKMREANIDPHASGPIVSRIVSPEEIKKDMANSYVPGTGQTARWDKLGGWFLLAVLGLCLVHGLARIMFKGNSSASEVSVKSTPHRIYPIGVRLLHWTNAALFIVLFCTGFSIHFPTSALSLPLEFSVDVHNTAAVLLTAHFLAFLLYSIATGEIKQYLPAPKDLMLRMYRQLEYYLCGIFSHAEKPYPTTVASRLNPVQQITYLLVYCLGMPVLICSGLLLMMPELAAKLAPSASASLLAAAHYVLALGYLAFLILHLYMSTTGTQVLSLIKGMITGYHNE